MTVDTHPVIVTLDQTADPHLVGGKAAGIARLARAGFPVPSGAVVPASVADEQLESAADALVEMFGGVDLAVRSSALGEDGSTTSMAGAFESVLDVDCATDAIAAAVRRVRASADDSVVGPVDMPVLVMPMVAADAAGIVFTRHPVTGADVVVVEAVQGLAHRLAAGLADGERWEINETVAGPEAPGVLDISTARRIADLAREIESALGGPQDVEWVLTGDDLVVIQARPITSAGDVQPIPIDEPRPPGPWEWDSTHSQRPMSPLHASFFPEAMRRGSRRLAQEYGLPIDRLEARTIGGYFHIMVVPPVGEPGGSPPPPWLFRLLFRVHPVLRRLAEQARRTRLERIDREWARRWRDEQRPAFEQMLEDWSRIDLETLTNAELAAHLEEVVATSQECFGWNMITDMSYLLPLAELQDFLAERMDVTMGDLMGLVAGSAPADYMQSVQRLQEMLNQPQLEALRSGRSGDVDSPEFWDAFAEHQRTTGSRGLGYDVADPTFAEAHVDELAVIAAVEPDDSAVDRAGREAQRCRTLLSAEDRSRFDALLAEARATFPIREGSEYTNARIAGNVRYAALEAGRRMETAGVLTDPEHIFFLEVAEIVAWLDEPTDVSAVVGRRRGEALWAAANPPTGGDEDELPDLASFPDDVAWVLRAIQLVQLHDARPPATADGAGLGVSAGQYTGPVRRVTGPAEFDRVQRGDVVIAPLTTSTWEAVFPLMGALVTEGGGMLSHPAIVAREHGLPAVTGFTGALERFEDGQIVTVDGATGTVTPRR